VRKGAIAIFFCHIRSIRVATPTPTVRRVHRSEIARSLAALMAWRSRHLVTAG
jgi:hypothetical protein